MDSRGYGLSATQKALYFDRDETKYAMWEERMLAYMNVKKTERVFPTRSSFLVRQARGMLRGTDTIYG